MKVFQGETEYSFDLEIEGSDFKALERDSQSGQIEFKNKQGKSIQCSYFKEGGSLHIHWQGEWFTFESKRLAQRHGHGSDAVDSGGSTRIKSPMPGKIIKIFIAEGDQVQKGDSLIILEAMKMEHTLKAPMDAKIEKITFQVGTQVKKDAILIQLEEQK